MPRVRLPALLIAWAASMAQPAAPEVAQADLAPSPGDRGYMLTVVEGDRIEEIPLVYLGLQRDLVGPGYDLHLVQLEGPIADRVGVAAGMSGSPVFFEGRLLGALAYRFGALPKQPVGGVTPLGDMLDAARAAARPASGGGAGVAPIGTPVQVAGLSPAVREWLTPQLEREGFVVLSGGSRDSADAPAEALRPGAPVGVELIRGDLSIAATGTVTHVDGASVYAFGHPFLGGGVVELPMVTAGVVHTLADLAGSVKLARVGTEVGAVIEDRLTAIVGLTGRQARMIPLDVRITGADYGDQRFHFEIARSTRLTPLLAAVSVANALSANLGRGEKSTMITSGTIRLAGLPPLPIELAAASGSGPDPAIGTAARLSQVVESLWANPFAEVELEGIDLAVSVSRDVRRYSVEELHYDRGPLRPGQLLVVECRLRSYRGEAVTRRFELRVPHDLPKGDGLALAVGPPEHIDRVTGQTLARRFRTARDVQSMSRVLGDLRSQHRLIGLLYHSAPGVVAAGVIYPDLPPSARHLMSSGPDLQGVGLIRVADLVRDEVALDGPIEGGLVVRLHVDSDLGGESHEAEDGF